MIYGYLRVSSDEQDVNSQKLGVDAFAKNKGWTIEEYITDEGVSGAKDPKKRNLGPLLKKLNAGDILIAAEISRLGRDLFMIMEILHHCMAVEAVVYTVKDNFVLGADIQSKVLAFAFGLSAEIERQMIAQRTKEGLRRRMLDGVLLGRPIGKLSSEEALKYASWKEKMKQMAEWKMSTRQIAAAVGCDRNTVYRLFERWGLSTTGRSKRDKEYRKEARKPTYKDTPYLVVMLDRTKMTQLIADGLTIPEIAKNFPEYTYEQVYDTILCDEEYNAAYRANGQKKLVRTRNR